MGATIYTERNLRALPIAIPVYRELLFPHYLNSAVSTDLLSADTLYLFLYVID